MCAKLPILLTLFAAASCALSVPAPATGPASPVTILPESAADRMRTQLAIQQAQEQARLAASQAKVQAMLDANQARLEGRAAAQRQLGAAPWSLAPSAQRVQPPASMLWSVQSSLPASIESMKLSTMTRQLGRYFGTDHGVLVVRAPAHGALKLQDGDVILSIGGRVPASSSQAFRILTSYDPGQKFTLEVLREHHRITLTTSMPSPDAGP